MKKTISFILSMIILLGLVGCSTQTNQSNVKNETVSSGEYLLTTTEGEIAIFDNGGNVISTVSLGGTPDSEFIYTIDNGNIYLSEIKDISNIPQILYAVDKTTRKLTMLSVDGKSIIKKAEMILSDGDISKIYAYNGILFYSVNTKNLKATQYSFERRQKLNKNGTLSYIQTVPLENTEDSTFIYMENYFAEYLEATGLSKYISESYSTILNIPKEKHSIYEIPTNVSTWTANTTNIYFFSETQMGTYNVITNKITVYYGAINPIDAQYIDGINKQIFLLSDFGEDSTTTMLMDIGYKNLTIKQALQIDYNSPIAMNIEKDKYIMMLYKVTNSEKTFSQLRVMNYEDKSELYVIGIDYLPTKILAKDDVAYMFNPYENYFLVGSIHSGAFTKVSKKTTSGEVYSDIFLIDTKYKSDYYYDDFGRYVNKNNHLINEDGELIDENNDRVNILGQRIDALSRAINKEGKLIDRYNNIIDEKGNILKYVINTDGYYYNSSGEKVDIDGTILVRNSEGDWVRPEDSDEAKIVITGHYDEFGNFIIDKDILDAYPNAYEMWQEQQLSSEDTTINEDK